MPSESGMDLQAEADIGLMEDVVHVPPVKKHGRVDVQDAGLFYGEDVEGNDEDIDSFIRVRNRSDGIFEQEDDEDDDDDYYDYAIPEVTMEVSGSRKRKQVLSYVDQDLTDMIDFNLTESLIQPYSVEEAETESGRKREKTPLYLLNPNNYLHDPKKQMQIRRAIITYRHHQDKKNQIIRLTEENTKLRLLSQSMKATMMEMKKCGCVKNKAVQIPDIDVTVPAVPPRLYIRGGRHVEGLHFDKNELMAPDHMAILDAAIKREVEISPSVPSQTMQNTAPAVKPSTSAPSVPRPLINITSARLANFNSKTLSSANVVTPSLPKPPLRRVLPNGSTTLSSSGSPSTVINSAGRHTIKISHSNSQAATRVGGFVPITNVKNEPTDSMSSNSSPSTATSASRIVFAKKGSTTNTAQTASELLFGNKKTLLPSLPSGTGGTTPDSFGLNGTVNEAFVQQKSSPVLQTASGRLLKLLQPQTAAALLQIPLPAVPTRNLGSRTASNQVQFRRLAPKPTVSKTSAAEHGIKSAEKKQMEAMWKQVDDDGNDEMAIIAALSGSTVPTRNRKQALGLQKQYAKPSLNKPSSQTKSNGLHSLQLNKYADIVFEEADEVE